MAIKKSPVTNREDQNGNVAPEETDPVVDVRPHLDVAFERPPEQTPKAAILPNESPIEASHLSISDKFSLPGHRPVFIGDLEISKTDTLPGHRPIEVSHLRISDKFFLPGQRPVFVSDVEISKTDTLPGHRPVFSSHLNARMGQLPENRPIASNDLGDSDLMGYI